VGGDNKVSATGGTLEEVFADIDRRHPGFRARVVDVATDALVIEATGTEEEIDALVALVRGFGIKEMVRTGSIVMVRGAQAVEVNA